MAGLDAIKSGITNLLGQTSELIGEKPAAAAGAAAVIGAGAGASIAGLIARRKTRKAYAKKRIHGKKRKRKTKRGRSGTRRGRGRHKHRKSPRGRLRYHTHRRRPSGKGIHYTKHGQPYIILSSGKAKFISKRGAKTSRKRKGGRY